MPEFTELRRLLAAKKIAALGTLHDGAPYVSMVPIVWYDADFAFVIHVSKLAAHTNDMLAEPRVSVLITASEDPEMPPQALPRVTIQGQAKPITTGSETYTAAKCVYLERFPKAAPIFQLGDFTLFAIVPTAVRWVAGFGRAYSITPVKFVEIMRS